MLLIISMLITATALVSLPRARRMLNGWQPAPLGWMSEQWLAEHRATHP